MKELSLPAYLFIDTMFPLNNILAQYNNLHMNTMVFQFFLFWYLYRNQQQQKLCIV